MRECQQRGKLLVCVSTKDTIQSTIVYCSVEVRLLYSSHSAVSITIYKHKLGQQCSRLLLLA